MLKCIKNNESFSKDGNKIISEIKCPVEHQPKLNEKTKVQLSRQAKKY